MAPRFAMYNMFLGLYAATETTSTPTCAVVALEATQTAATAWNATQEDPDIAADLTLVGEFITNLAAVGADTTGEYTPQTCATAGESVGDTLPGDPVSYPGDGPAGFMCSVGATPIAFVPVAFALLVTLRRRRRR